LFPVAVGGNVSATWRVEGGKRQTHCRFAVFPRSQVHKPASRLSNTGVDDDDIDDSVGVDTVSLRWSTRRKGSEKGKTGREKGEKRTREGREVSALQRTDRREGTHEHGHLLVPVEDVAGRRGRLPTLANDLVRYSLHRVLVDVAQDELGAV
jgi:hypothetical protein